MRRVRKTEEGSCKTKPSVNDRIKFLFMAKGSSAELGTQIYIGMEIGYIEREKGCLWVAETKGIAAMLAGLIRKQPDFGAD
ncbi:four helix bundle protein [Halomonas elongata]|uniref:four helix bundle protein n=1 Tax=Halomonas elongata TaxID=2746 RepID=UPI0038D39B67